MLPVCRNLLKGRITKLEGWRMGDALGFPLSRFLERTSLLRDPLLEAFCWVSETYSLNPDTALKIRETYIRPLICSVFVQFSFILSGETTAPNGIEMPEFVLGLLGRLAGA